MFFVHNLCGQVMAYEAGRSEVARRSKVAPMRAISPVPSGDDPWQSSEVRLQQRSAEGAVAAYEARSPKSTRKRLLLLRQIMSSPVSHLAYDQPLAEALRLFERAKIRHAPALGAQGSLVGVLSQRDVLRAQADSPVGLQKPVSHLMTSQVLTARPETSIRRAAEVMLEARVGCLPIVCEHQQLLGIVTRSDILRAVVVHAPLELWG